MFCQPPQALKEHANIWLLRKVSCSLRHNIPNPRALELQAQIVNEPLGQTGLPDLISTGNFGIRSCDDFSNSVSSIARRVPSFSFFARLT